MTMFACWPQFIVILNVFLIVVSPITKLNTVVLSPWLSIPHKSNFEKKSNFVLECTPLYMNLYCIIWSTYFVVLFLNLFQRQFWNWSNFQWIIKAYNVSWFLKILILEDFFIVSDRRRVHFFTKTNLTVRHISVRPHHYFQFTSFPIDKKFKSSFKDYEIISMLNFDWRSRSSWLSWLYHSKWATVPNVERIIWWTCISKKWRKKRIRQIPNARWRICSNWSFANCL